MSKEKVLIIEDDKDIREGVRILLESENYRVQEAENGRQDANKVNQMKGWDNEKGHCCHGFGFGPSGNGRSIEDPGQF